MKSISSNSRRRGIYLLPSVFTVANIFCGFYSVVSSIRGDMAFAALLIGAAVLLDALDGRVARFANSSSEFGKEFDSLADQVSFGVAPMVLAFQWGLHLWPRLGWLSGFLFVVCGAMRLARFNTQQAPNDRRFFVGMPIPAAASVVAALVYQFPAPMVTRADSLPLLGLILMLSLLMVSGLKYYSFKDLDIRRRHPHLVILIFAFFIVAVFTHPQVVLLTMATTYAVSGIVFKFSALFRSNDSLKTPVVKAGVYKDHSTTDNR